MLGYRFVRVAPAAVDKWDMAVGEMSRAGRDSPPQARRKELPCRAIFPVLLDAVRFEDGPILLRLEGDDAEEQIFVADWVVCRRLRIVRYKDVAILARVIARQAANLASALWTPPAAVRDFLDAGTGIDDAETAARAALDPLVKSSISRASMAERCAVNAAIVAAHSSPVTAAAAAVQLAIRAKALSVATDQDWADGLASGNIFGLEAIPATIIDQAKTLLSQFTSGGFNL